MSQVSPKALEIGNETGEKLALLEYYQQKNPQEGPVVYNSEFTERVYSEGRKVDRLYMTNQINYINFQDGCILINFHHLKYNDSISLHAKPQPSLGEEVSCTWSTSQEIELLLKSYKFENIYLVENEKVILIKPSITAIDKETIAFLLPEHGYEISARKLTRHPCLAIKARFIQNSRIYEGSLINFTPETFRIEMDQNKGQLGVRPSSRVPANLILEQNNFVYFAGPCDIVEHEETERERTCILRIRNTNVPIRSPKKHRSKRQVLFPQPNMVFSHPLTGKELSLKICDLSGTGFSVEESEASSFLLAGLAIPKAEIAFPSGLAIKCSLQVVYRQSAPEADVPLVRCGIAFLDMHPNDYTYLISYLHQADNQNYYVCNRVNVDKLIKFFFDTNFIYPEKYKYLRSHRQNIKETYKKLYTANQGINRYFIYQDLHGAILGHMSMVHFYKKAWIIHHHAARQVGSKRSGIKVLRQIGRFVNDAHSMQSINMDYVLCYFKPDKKFPSRVFGGACSFIKNRKSCSIDTFSYFTVADDSRVTAAKIDEGWSVAKALPFDIREFEIFYESVSGGLATFALDLRRNSYGSNYLGEEYARLGLAKEKYHFALHYEGRLAALLVADVTDAGLNLSNLTHCLQVYILEQERVNREVFYAFVKEVLNKIGQNEMPVLVYPHSFADREGITVDKLYNLWVLNMRETDSYLEYSQKLIRRI